jgi:hypothetical protein
MVKFGTLFADKKMGRPLGQPIIVPEFSENH